MTFIQTYTKKGTLFAEVRTSERIDGVTTPRSKIQYLGKVINLEKGIFKNNKLGIFRYNLNDGFEQSDFKDDSYINFSRKEKLILDFGSSYLLSEFIKSNFILNLFKNTLQNYSDTLLAMIFYYIEVKASNRDAEKWFDGSFSNLLFPSAQIKSQRISELLEKLGNESVVRSFFTQYIQLILPEDKKTCIIVDSTGLPNAIHFPLTAISTHNGETVEEVRLIFIIDRKTGMPIYFRYNAGNIVDISTLKQTLDELKKIGVSVTHSLLDAGYCSENNIKKLYKDKIKFLTRIPNNRKIYKEAFKIYNKEALESDNRYIYKDRVIGIKRIFTKISSHRVYLYLCVDYNSRNDQIRHYMKNIDENKIKRSKWELQTKKYGFFGLLSSEKLDPKELLPLYYTRQTVEQIFDISKTNINILPLRIHNEETFRGHIMLSFMSVLLYMMLNKCFEDSKNFNASNSLMLMRNLKCKVFDNSLLVSEPTKDMKKICKILDINIPEQITLPISKQP